MSEMNISERHIETRRLAKPLRPKKGGRAVARLSINLPSKHFLDAVKAEAAVRNMSLSSFMRAMIRGYFGAA